MARIKDHSATVGISTLNGPERLARCLQSIREETRWDRLGPCKLLVCDDCSTGENLEHNRRIVCDEYRDLQQLAGLEMLMNTERSGIAASWNKLARHQLSDVLVLLNDDIEVSRDWLEVLVYSVMENRRAAMVALNSYVGLTRSDITELHPGAARHRLFPRLDYVESQLLSGQGELLTSLGSAFAVRTEVYDEVGGFDERYFCFYEELDFGVACCKAGYAHYNATHPVLFHMGGATTSDGRNLSASREFARSRAAFRAKWGKSPAEVQEELRAARASESLQRAAERMGERLALREWNSSIGNVEEQ
jgi:GT2 family glycosyltransferase